MMSEMSELLFKNNFPCPNCKGLINFNDGLFSTYFLPIETICPHCNFKQDIWKIFKDLCKEQHIFGFHYGLLGCEGKTKKITLEKNKTYELDLSDEIGEGELLFINYTSDSGGLHPIEVHNNTPQQHIKPKKIYLYGRPLRDDAKNTEVTILYWHSTSEIKDNIGMILLLDAFKRYYEKNYRYMIISASTAVEIAQTRFFLELLKSSGLSAQKIKQFLIQNATFSSQLKILLPFLADKMEFPMLKKEVYDALLNLRTDRNDVVHEGVPKNGWKDERIEDELISALFAFKYYEMVSNMTIKEKGEE